MRDFPEVEDMEGEVGGRHPEVCRDTLRASGGRADVFLKDILDEMRGAVEPWTLPMDSKRLGEGTSRSRELLGAGVLLYHDDGEK